MYFPSETRYQLQPFGQFTWKPCSAAEASTNWLQKQFVDSCTSIVWEVGSERVWPEVMQLLDCFAHTHAAFGVDASSWNTCMQISRYNHLIKTYQQASEKGLARFLAFLREEEEYERLQEIEHSRPVGFKVIWVLCAQPLPSVTLPALTWSTHCCRWARAWCLHARLELLLLTHAQTTLYSLHWLEMAMHNAWQRTWCLFLVVGSIYASGCSSLQLGSINTISPSLNVLLLLHLIM